MRQINPAICEKSYLIRYAYEYDLRNRHKASVIFKALSRKRKLLIVVRLYFFIASSRLVRSITCVIVLTLYLFPIYCRSQLHQMGIAKTHLWLHSSVCYVLPNFYTNNVTDFPLK